MFLVGSAGGSCRFLTFSWIHSLQHLLHRSLLFLLLLGCHHVCEGSQVSGLLELRGRILRLGLMFKVKTQVLMLAKHEQGLSTVVSMGLLRFYLI